MTDTKKPKAKALVGIFAQQWQGSVHPKTQEWTADLDRNGNRIPAEAFTVVVENGTTDDLPPVISAKRVKKLSTLRDDLHLQDAKDYVLVRSRDFDGRDGRIPAIKGWYRPKAEPISI